MQLVYKHSRVGTPNMSGHMLWFLTTWPCTAPIHIEKSHFCHFTFEHEWASQFELNLQIVTGSEERTVLSQMNKLLPQSHVSKLHKLAWQVGEVFLRSIWSRPSWSQPYATVLSQLKLKPPEQTST